MLRQTKWVGGGIVLLLALVAAGCGGSSGHHGGAATPTPVATPAFRLTVLHANDADSRVIDGGPGLPDFGGAARFVTVLDRLRSEAADATRDGAAGWITITAGNNILASPEFNASLDSETFYDARAVDFIEYDAMALGSQEFDFGPDLLVRFIAQIAGPAPYLTVNLGFGQEPELQALADGGRIVPSVVVDRGGTAVGIIGITTPDLRFVSSPGNVDVVQNLTAVVQAEVDRLTARGIEIIVLASSVQRVADDVALIGTLRNVDIVAAGGGEILANPADVLVPGDDISVVGPYPLRVADANGLDVLLVTTGGGYRYVGRLVVDFDAAGHLVAVDGASGPVRVAGGEQPDRVAPDPFVDADVVAPVADSVSKLAAHVIASSEADLDGQLDAVRSRETNLGDLAADALLWQAQRLAAGAGAVAPNVAFQNGGGLRLGTVLPAGDFTELDTFAICPFPNFITIVAGITPAQVKEMLENAVSKVDQLDGRFAQVAGLRFVWDPAGTAQVLDDNLNVVTPGTRIRTVSLDDDTPIVIAGVPVAEAPDVVAATINFLANGGDQYPFRDAAPVVRLNVSYQQALRNYVVDGLDAVISAERYPAGGSNRITITPVP